MPRSLGPILGRVVAVIAVLLLIGIVLRLIAAILQPMLPAALMRDLAAGWDMLYGIVSPAMGPIMAIGILCAAVWVVIGMRR